MIQVSKNFIVNHIMTGSNVTAHKDVKHTFKPKRHDCFCFKIDTTKSTCHSLNVDIFMFCSGKKAQDFSFLWPLCKRYTSVYSY